MATLQAIRSFKGTEGTIRRGDIFEVESENRAQTLIDLELAIKTAEKEVTNFEQKQKTLKGLTKDELIQVAADEEITIDEAAKKDEIFAAIETHREKNYSTSNQKGADQLGAGFGGSAATDGGTSAGTTTGATGPTGATGATGATGGAGNSGQ